MLIKSLIVSRINLIVFGIRSRWQLLGFKFVKITESRYGKHRAKCSGSF